MNDKTVLFLFALYALSKKKIGQSVLQIYKKSQNYINLFSLKKFNKPFIAWEQAGKASHRTRPVTVDQGK